METKPLLYGLIGFFLGGILVSMAATYLPQNAMSMNADTMTMDDMTAILAEKTGDEYDEAFLRYMIDHHHAAVDMSKLSEEHARHDEIKQLSDEIVEAQEQEIEQMQQWLVDWGYADSDEPNSAGR